MAEPSYPFPVSKLLTLGDCRHMRGWPDYLGLGLAPEHIPDLILMALDEEFHWADGDSVEVWAPVHAWRALGQLGAEAAAEPLTRLLVRADDFGDDWVGEELPKVFAKIGPSAIPVLADYLADPSHKLWARVAAASGICEIGSQHPDACRDGGDALAKQLEAFAELDPTLNAFLVSYLVKLKAVDAVPVMEKAFASGRVDISVGGDWEDVQIELGLLRKRQTPRPNYHQAFLDSLEVAPPSPPEKRRKRKRK